MSCFDSLREFVPTSVNTDLPIPLNGNPLDFGLATEGDVGHSSQFLSEEFIGLADSQRQGTTAIWMTLCRELNAMSFWLISWKGDGAKKMPTAGWAQNPGPCQVDKVLGSIHPRHCSGLDGAKQFICSEFGSKFSERKKATWGTADSSHSQGSGTSSTGLAGSLSRMPIPCADTMASAAQDQGD